ncbi:NUDIX hydrolase [Nocardioides sp.]|uniref:NUDIX hydrolase n=1 Tax=Nocardioides sp. TaxID=35761 RepID=UPI002ED4F33E
MPQRRDVLAAGAVVFRPGRRVLLVHRPRYDDWSFPKGKLDPGEHAAVAAVREVAEETGLHVRLGPPLDSQRYPVDARGKTVHYWVGWPVGDDDVSGYLVNDEIDDVVWLPYDDAIERLSYERDRATLAAARRLRKQTRALVVLRHGKARSRKAWTKKPDQLRPLLSLGHDQAQRLVTLLAAYDVTRLVTSSSTRCVQTLQPYADSTGWDLEAHDGLTEEEATKKSVDVLIGDLLEDRRSSVLCTHRPVLPRVFEALGVEDEKLDPGAMLVAHHRKGRVVSAEIYTRP